MKNTARYCIVADHENEEATYVVRPCHYIGNGNWNIGECFMYTPDIQDAALYLESLVNVKNEEQ